MISKNGQHIAESSTDESPVDLSLVEKVARFAEKSFKGIVDSALEFRSSQSATGTSIGFTGCGNQSGTTSTAIHAGIYSAISRGEKTLVIDANFKNPMIGKNFGLDPDVGLSDCLVDLEKIDNGIKKTVVSQLSILPSGKQTLKSQKNLTQRFENLIEKVTGEFSFVFVDFPDAYGQVVPLLGKACDRIILVANPSKNQAKRIRIAKKRLVKNDIDVSGLFLNQHQN